MVSMKNVPRTGAARDLPRVMWTNASTDDWILNQKVKSTK